MDGGTAPPDGGYWDDERAVEAWLMDQKHAAPITAKDTAHVVAAADHEAEGSSDTISTVFGETQELEALQNAEDAATTDSDGGFTTIEGESAVIHDLLCEEAGTADADDVGDGSTGCTTLDGEAEALTVLQHRLPARAPRAVTAVAACVRGFLQRQGRLVTCYLDGASVNVRDYPEYLQRECAHLSALLPSLPAHLRVTALPHPPEIPAPTDNSTPLHVRNYNRAALKIFKSWLPVDAQRGHRQYTVADTFAHYGMLCPEIHTTP